MTRKVKDAKHQQGGFMIILVLVCLIFVLGAGVFALETANYFLTQVQVQKASDMASITGTDIYLKGASEADVRYYAERAARNNISSVNYGLDQINTIEVNVVPTTLPPASQPGADLRPGYNVEVNTLLDRRAYLPLRSLLGVPDAMTVAGIASTRVPNIAVSLVLDKSASMLWPVPMPADPDLPVNPNLRNRMRNMQDAAIATSRRMQGLQDSFAVVMYDHRPEVLLPMGTPWDVPTLTAQIEALTADGGTGLASAHELARNEILNANIAANVTKYILVVTDGSVGNASPLRITPDGFNPSFEPNITPRTANFDFEVWDYYLGFPGPGCGEGPQVPGCGIPPAIWDPCEANCLSTGILMEATQDSLEAEDVKFVPSCGDYESSPVSGTDIFFQGTLQACTLLYTPGMTTINFPPECTDTNVPRGCEAYGTCCNDMANFSIVGPDGYITPPVPPVPAAIGQFHILNNILEADYSRANDIYVYALYAGPVLTPTDPNNYNIWGDDGLLFRRITMDPLGDNEPDYPMIPEKSIQLALDMPGQFLETDDTTADFFRQYSRYFNGIRFERLQ